MSTQPKPRKSWGFELWDRYDNAVKEVQQGCKDLESWYGAYLRERSKVEADYAKALRKLVKNFTIKEKHRQDEEETTQAKGFRLLLEELGYQAGQHEMVSDCYGKDSSSLIDNHIKNVKLRTKKIKKEADEINTQMKLSYKQLDKSKINYAEAHAELEAIKTAAESDEKNLSRLELDKKISLTNKKTRLLDDAKAQYAHQLIKTNNHQKLYFKDQVSSVLNSLEDVYIDNIELLKTVYSNCIEYERCVAPIIGKCHSEMLNIVKQIDTDMDTNNVINRLKTGNVPPADFQFEELESGSIPDIKSSSGYLEKRNSLLRSKSKQSLVRDRNSTNTSVNYFQLKRELEKNLSAVENEVSKGQKEMKSLQLMVATYKNNPKFGDVKKFELELESVTLRVQHSQSQLLSLQNKLYDVNKVLENIKNKNNSNEELTKIASEYHTKPQTASTVDIQIDNGSRHLKSVINIAAREENTSDFDDEDYFDSSVSFKSDGTDDIPEVKTETKAQMWIEKHPCAVAMYKFTCENSETLDMSEAEEFTVLEDDVEGWTKVRRKNMKHPNQKEFGYVPTSFLKFMF